MNVILFVARAPCFKYVRLCVERLETWCACHEQDNVHEQPVSNNVDNPGWQMNFTENFRDKYTKSGRIGGWLINHFYGVINEFVRKCTTETKTVLEIGVGEGF